ncbi:MAG: hypothetical protein IAG13_00115, partial [Deltaproteobacteria bacterium]|nr:hypothetical protein [Nannocystaceae bacterium]
MLAALAGCGEEPRATLVAFRGCGLDDEELSSLVVLPRGDFPSAAVESQRVATGTVRLPELPDDAAAITVEGKFGDVTEAVGRTARLHGVDGEVPVYFAPEDQMCSLVAAVAWREDAAIAASRGGDIVVAGGRDEIGRP